MCVAGTARFGGAIGRWVRLCYGQTTGASGGAGVVEAARAAAASRSPVGLVGASSSGRLGVALSDIVDSDSGKDLGRG